jgi:membrane protein YdbS with pleckstrin-like domain
MRSLNIETVQSTWDTATLSLNTGETELYRSGVHWIVLGWPILAAVLVLSPGILSLIGVFAHGGSLGGSVILVAIGSFFLSMAAAVLAIAFLKRNSTGILVTNQRLILIGGIFRVRVSYSDLGRIAKVTVRQGMLGKRLGFGTVVINYVWGTVDRIKNVPNPTQLSQCLLAQESPISRPG